MSARWSKADTHCALCARPFATSDEETRHAEKECGEPCWCLDFCWVEQGGDCLYELEHEDPFELVLQLRGELEAALGASHD